MSARTARSIVTGMLESGESSKTQGWPAGVFFTIPGSESNTSGVGPHSSRSPASSAAGVAETAILWGWPECRPNTRLVWSTMKTTWLVPCADGHESRACVAES